MRFGIELEFTRHKKINSTDFFKRKYDASCGYEYVSKPMIFNDLRHVKKFLESAKLLLPLSHRCGFHVHFDRTNISDTQRKKLFTFFRDYHHQILRLHSSSRRNNMYVQIPNLEYFYDHYSAVNYSTRHNTIEFRHGAGTTNYDYVRHWILFLACIINASKYDFPNENELIPFFKALKITHPTLKRNRLKVIEWLEKRINNTDLNYVR